MRPVITTAYLAGVLQKATVISRGVKDPVTAQFGDPLRNIAGYLDCQDIANAIMNANAGYKWLNTRRTMLLTWTKINGRLRLELSSQSEHYAPTITAVHEHFKKAGLMDMLNLVH